MDNTLVPFTEDPFTHQQCFNVTIIDDELLEDMERFSFNLSLVEGSTHLVNVFPSVSEVEIVDDDRKQHKAKYTAIAVHS